MKYSFYEIFRGSKDEKGRVLKRRAVGHCIFNEQNAVSTLQLNGMKRDKFYLEPEEDPNTSHDFLICFYRQNNQQVRESVGIGNLLTGVNSGLIQLDFDIFGQDDLYLNLGQVEEAKVAA